MVSLSMMRSSSTCSRSVLRVLRVVRVLGGEDGVAEVLGNFQNLAGDDDSAGAAEAVDAHCARARAAGVEVVVQPEDQEHGGRLYAARDPGG